MKPGSFAAIVAAWSVCVTGCGRTRPFAAPPRINHGNTELYATLDPRLQTPNFEIFYVTDRNIVRDTETGPEYGFGRRMGLTYGVANCGLQQDVTWDELVEISTRDSRRTGGVLEVKSVEQLGEVKPTVDLFEVRDDRIELRPDAMDELAREQAEMQKTLDRWIQRTPYRDAYVNVHGFNTEFDGSMLRIAELWHYIGRRGVPIAYSWPAGRGGLLGYFFDRESGEFTVVHLKLLLMALAKSDNIDRVHVIAHSRGADVALTALRELNISFRGRGVDPQKELKLETFVLAAPDLDTDIFAQRFFGENMVNMANRTVIYFSSRDSALRLASWLFSGSRRIGRRSPDELDDRLTAVLPQLPRLQFVYVDLRLRGLETHSHVFSDPAAMSDLVLVLRDRLNAGSWSGRPLTPFSNGTWVLDENYPQFPDGSDPTTAPAEP